MRVSVGLLASLAALAWALPGATAEAPATESFDAAQPSAADSADAARCAGPPCGWIQPEFILDFPEKPQCRTSNRAPADPAACLQLPLKGETLVQKGTMRWWWDVTLDGIYPIAPPNPDIQISFAGTGMNPKWMKAEVTPGAFTVTQQTLADPANFETNLDDPQHPKVYYAFKAPIEVTFTRTGDPSAAEMRKIDNAGGVVAFTVKAVSTESGSFYKAAFGTELFNFWPTDFGFEADTTPQSGTPVPVVPIAVGGAVAAAALGVGAFFWQRRRI